MVDSSRPQKDVMSAAFEAAAVALVVVDELGHIAHANAPAVDLLATTGEVREGAPLADRIAVLDDIEATWSSLAGADSENAPGYQVVVLRDVGLQRAAMTNLIVARKMEALGEMAGSIAHEFNNHLSGASGFAQLAQSGVNDAERLKACLAEIIAALEAGAKLVSRIMVFGRKQDREQEAITIAPHILDAANLISPMLDGDVALSFEVDAEESGRIQVSPGEMTEVLLNLTDNAAQAIKSAGVNPAEISISLKHVDIEGEQARALADAPPGPYLAIAVADNGCGMTQQVRERMFDPFFTTREVGDGEGLGLALVYTVVGRAQGRIDIKTAPAAGTTVTMYFPLVT